MVCFLCCCYSSTVVVFIFVVGVGSPRRSSSLVDDESVAVRMTMEQQLPPDARGDPHDAILSRFLSVILIVGPQQYSVMCTYKVVRTPSSSSFAFSVGVVRLFTPAPSAPTLYELPVPEPTTNTRSRRKAR